MESHFALMRHRWAMGVDLHSWDTQMSYGVSLCMYETQMSYRGHFALMRHRWAMECHFALMQHKDELWGVTALMRHIWDMGVTLHSRDTQMSYGMYIASILGEKECYWSEGVEYEVKMLNFGSKDTLPNWFFWCLIQPVPGEFHKAFNSLRPSDAYMHN